MKPLIESYLRRRSTSMRLSPREGHTVDAIEDIVQYRFRSRDLAVQALTHPSYPGVSRESYQRLEFVGDAVLGMLAMIHVLREG